MNDRQILPGHKLRNGLILQLLDPQKTGGGMGATELTLKKIKANYYTSIVSFQENYERKMFFKAKQVSLCLQKRQF